MYGTSCYGEAAYGSSSSLDELRSVELPALTLTAALLDFSGSSHQGQLVRGVAVPWFEIVRLIQHDPANLYQLGWRELEEIIAGAYIRAGYDEVILTPRSGDGGKDIIATRNGVGSIRIFGQVKAYTPPRHVTADEVRSLLGAVAGDPNVSKGMITTTSEFAPRLMDDPAIALCVPYKLELMPRDELLTWLKDLSHT